jgi:hypothetical protein
MNHTKNRAGYEDRSMTGGLPGGCREVKGGHDGRLVSP